MNRKFIALAWLAAAGWASAQTLQGIKVEPASARVGDEVTLTANFDVSGGLNCNVRIEFGDGAQQNVAINQLKDATTVLRHRYDKAGNYTASVKPVTRLPLFKCLGDIKTASVVVAAAADKPVAPTAAAEAPQCPAGWKLDARSVNKKTGAFTCSAKAGTTAPSGKLACPGDLGYFENVKKGQLGCRP
jgi:hypothetical protein